MAPARLTSRVWPGSSAGQDPSARSTHSAPDRSGAPDATPGHAGSGLMARLTPWARRGSAVVDAGVSSVGNLAVSVLGARALNLEAFGLLATAMLVGLIVVGVSRALFGDVLTLSYSHAAPGDHRRHARRVSGAALAGSVLAAPVVGLVLFAVSVASGADSSTGAALGVALAVSTPFLVLQELMRAVAYSAARPFAALPNTVVWTGTLLAAFIVVHLRDVDLSPAGYLAVWGLSAAPGAAMGLFLTGALPRFEGVAHWWRDHKRLMRQLLADYGLTQVTAEASVVLIAVVAGASEAGLLRKAQIPLAPIVILTSGIILIGQPALVRAVGRGSSVSHVRSVAYRIGALAGAVSLLASFVVMVVPERIMTEIVGGDWDRSRTLVPFVGLYLALGAMAACQGVALRALSKLGQQVRLRLMLTPVILGVVSAGAVGGAFGAVIGLCAGVALVVLAWAWLLRDGYQPRHRGETP